jgi:hypothetical protein
MKRGRTLNKALAASLLIFGLTSSARADEKIDPAGTWVVQASRPGRPAQESTLKLEKNGDQLVGVITDAQGRTGTIKDAKLTGNEISFRVEVERDGQQFNFNYKGKLTKDTMKGTVAAKILGRELTFDFDGKRAKESATLTGSWKLSLGFGGGQRAQQGAGARPQGAGGRGRPGGGRPGMPQMMLNLREEGGKVSGDFIGFGGKATPIQDAKVKDGELTFKVPQELGPNKVTLEFVGKLAGDKLQGTAKIPLPQGTRSLGFQGERTKAATANAGGTWKLKVALKDGPTFEPTLKLTQTGTTLKGTYVGEQGETPISNALIFGEEVTFDVNRNPDGKKYRLHYQGKIKGDALTGSVDYDFDGIIGFVDFKGERVSASTASSDKAH